jgi:hypothetical protein
MPFAAALQFVGALQLDAVPSLPVRASVAALQFVVAPSVGCGLQFRRIREGFRYSASVLSAGEEVGEVEVVVAFGLSGGVDVWWGDEFGAAVGGEAGLPVALVDVGVVSAAE